MMYKHFFVFWLIIWTGIFSSCCNRTAVEEYSILPTPVSLVKGEGGFELKNGVVIGVSDERLLPAATYLQEILQKAVTTSIVVGKGDINLTLETNEEKEGAYHLSVTDQSVTATASTYAGIICAISTIRQMLPPGIEQPSQGQCFSIPAATINDSPRFEWRGMMMDASRHFWNKEEVKRFLDLMALYKLNKFHWHLTDDQGWRIEIKQYPLLTEKGAWRSFDKNDRNCLELAVSQDNPDFLLPTDKMRIEKGDTLYGGYYTQEEIKEVVAYATQRGIEVIPEVDMPGHFLAAITQFPDLACTGMIGWGDVFSSPICPGKDATLQFCKNIYQEIFQLFPSSYVHLGADEVEKKNWKKCADCRNRIQKEKLSSVESLQAWFVRQMEQYFKENGKTMIGWDEVIEDNLSDDAVIMWWRSWAPNAVRTATQQGKRVIECPNSLFYFDAYQDRNSIKQILAFDPLGDNLSADHYPLVMGVQANFWAEGIPSMRRLEYLAMPRVMALSEVAWASHSSRIRDADFQQAATPHFRRLEKMGINYRIPDLHGFYQVNAFVDSDTLCIVSPLPGIEIRYTTDGTIPTQQSALYKEPVRVDCTTNFAIRPFRPDGTSDEVIRTRFVKAPYSKGQVVAGALTPGLKVSWHDFRGDSCSQIPTAPLNGTYVVHQVSIPEGVKGNVGLIFRGYLDLPADGVYTFYLMSDDGSIVTINGDVFLQNDGPHSPKDIVAQKALAKGLHPIEIRYFDWNGGVFELMLVDESGKRIAIPSNWLKH